MKEVKDFVYIAMIIVVVYLGVSINNIKFACEQNELLKELIKVIKEKECK